jgi:hypothetical protein
VTLGTGYGYGYAYGYGYGYGFGYLEAPTHTLTYTPSAGGTITGTDPQTVNAGGAGTAVTAVPNTGYYFANWSDGSKANPRTDTNVHADVTVTANFFGTGAGGTTTPVVTTTSTATTTGIEYGSTSGGGGGGGGGYSNPYTYTSGETTGSGTGTGTGSTSGSGLSLLNALIAQLRVLLQEAQAQGVALPPGAAAFLAGTGSTPSAITESLTVGSKGADVTTLQAFLIAQAKGPAAKALASAGATGYFGTLTQAALAEYQAAAGITPAHGYFGPITRAYLSSKGE